MASEHVQKAGTILQDLEKGYRPENSERPFGKQAESWQNLAWLCEIE